MKIIIMMSVFLTLMFTLTKHPLSMGCILLLQTIMASLMCGLNMGSYLLSYVLFLIFIGGMLILFMYMSSIASNEKFYMFNIISIITMLLVSLIIIGFINSSLSYNSYLTNISSLHPNMEFMMNKLYSLPSGMLTLMIVIYLLFTLIVVSNIVGIKFSPLRSYN
uniref:NADH-ubiquinone oxidoreductase chain 6 n=1 Tax=Mendozana platypleura TaxID=2219948 RepID=A0A3S7MGQ5_9HEMI|nr:NADH dehydrogenase subunit 6 [Mendozana platypleura]